MEAKFSMLIVFPIIIQLFGITQCSNQLVSQVSATLHCAREYDFIYLVQQWQISLCDLNPCLKPARPVFSISGFRPSYFSGTPSCKTGSLFDPKKISDLKNGLESEWPSLLHEDSNEDWKAEWETHGIRSESVFTQHRFFKTALKLKNKYKLINMLADKAIFPFGNVYSVENITYAIQTATGHNPQVECSLFRLIPLLLNIFLCFDRSAANMIDCPKIQRCKYDTLLFPFDLFQRRGEDFGFGTMNRSRNGK